MKKKILIFFTLIYGVCASAQEDAKFLEFEKEFRTYPFSDPDPIPASQKLYPYYRFDGFTDVGVTKSWKVVQLENDYIQVQIMPEIGGKIWNAQDKKSGKYFLYNNDVVKFRDIAMRGPWVSGGIETNYGIIGHTPNTATPVDYDVRKNSDGSVSCFTSTLDLLTRTRWVIEIRLEKDKAYFSTRSYWFNATGVEQPYYTWMNAAIPAGADLQFIYPGTHFIGHDGRAGQWPMDLMGRDLSHYNQGDFGDSKSFHILGTHSNYFGALWHEQDFGMIHYAKRNDKVGRKVFYWAQSESGRIWEDLLTDHSGQYVEIQSGRLFNQNMLESSQTPFRQTGFAPYVNDEWTEYWYPFKGLNGFSQANMLGAFNVESADDALVIRMSPVQVIRDSVHVFNDKNSVIASGWVDASPLETIQVKMALPDGELAAGFSIGNQMVSLADEREEKALSRPLVSGTSPESNSAYSSYLLGRDLADMRNYADAEAQLSISLSNDPNLIPALVELAKLKIFSREYDQAFDYAQRALAIDTYDGAANYYYGVAATYLSRKYDALDGFEIATITNTYRSAAYTALSCAYLRDRDLATSAEYAALGLREQPHNLDLWKVKYLLGRLGGNKEAMEDAENRISIINPLDPFIRFENYYEMRSESSKKEFVRLIRNEMPTETFLELAIWYHHLGLNDESRAVLELAPQNAEVRYWLAWLFREDDPQISQRYLKEADLSDVAFVFPFRQESAEVFVWASAQTGAWQADYLLALIYHFRNHSDHALALLEKHGDRTDFAPFYILRSQLENDELAKLTDIERAVKLDPQQWRYGLLQARALMQVGRGKEALAVLGADYHAHKENFVVGLEYARYLVKAARYSEAETVLADMKVLPFEGAGDSRAIYRQVKLMLANKAIAEGKYQMALKKIAEAEEWPTHLGVGKPYDDQIDNSIENLMKGIVFKKKGQASLAKSYFDKVSNPNVSEDTYEKTISDLIGSIDQRIFQ